jgi:prepilin-type N-terminal cleavage/methylation domain-containing protein
MLGGFLLRKQARRSGERVIPSELSLRAAGETISPSAHSGANGRANRGFTLIEVIIAMAILLIIVVSVLMLATVSAASLKDSEARDMAKNIATYTVEYLRSRNVTSDNLLGHNPSELGNDSSSNFPGFVDLWDSPLKPNSSSTTDTVNKHPALPNQYFSNFDTNNNKLPDEAIMPFYSVLQGFVSNFSDDANANDSGGGVYVDKITNAPYAVQFPSAQIKAFTALSGYNCKIYTTDNSKTTTSSSEYDPHYTNDATGTMAYRGFRVLTQIAARKKLNSTSTHVEYYDVKVTVFWILGSKEHSYSLATQITTYGGS